MSILFYFTVCYRSYFVGVAVSSSVRFRVLSLAG